MIISLGAALVRSTFPFALISAVAAGLAFSTKYIGAVVLPFDILPLALSTLASESISRRVLPRLFLQGLAMVGVFLAVFVLTNPHALFDHAAFVDRFIWQLKYSSNGYGNVGSPNPLLWLDPLQTQFGAVGVIYLLGGFLLACILLLRDLRLAGWRESFSRDDLRTRLVLTLYVLATSLHLAISIHQREVRFLYHVVPFLLILSTSAMLGLIVGLTKGFVRPQWTIAALAASLLVFASCQIGFDLRAMAETTRRSESAPIKFGNFIASHYPADTKILADSYTYLPPSMTNVTYADLQTEKQLGEVAPALIVITRGATGSSVWKKAGTSFSEGKFDVDRSYSAAAQAEPYLNKLASPSSGWSVVQESDSEILL